MTSRDLIAAFESVADAPEGVDRLRELVLELAVRGRLVPQDPKDEPAGKFLGERQAQVSNGTAWMELPGGWAWTSLARLGEVLGGGTPSKANSDFWRGSIPWVSPKDMKVDRLGDAQDHISQAAVSGSAVKLIPSGSLLMVVRGMILAHSFPTALTTTKVTVNQDMKALVPFRSDIGDYLLFVSKAMKPRVLDLVEHSTHGTCKLSTDRLLRLPIPVPPLAEQRRIVARVDELMGLLDRLEAAQSARNTTRTAARNAALAALREADDADAVEESWSRVAGRLGELCVVPEDVKPLREAVLDLAVRGRLVPQDPGDEPVTNLLETLREEQERVRVKSRKGTARPPVAEQPFPVPLGWRWTHLEVLLADGPTNGWSPQAVDYETSVRTLRLSATTSGRFKGENFKFVDAALPPDSPLWLEPGDLLIQRSNTPEYVGMAAVFDGSPRTFIYPDLMMRCRTLPSAQTAFVHLCLVSPYCRSWFRERASGTSQSMVKVGQEAVRSIPLPIPPLAEQRRIVAKVEQLMGILDRLAESLTKSQTTQAAFAAAAVHQLDT